MVLMLVALVAVNLIYQDKIWRETSQLFSREISAIETKQGGMSAEETRKATFAGRWYAWDEYINQYMNRSLFGMVFGNGNPGASHNDFLANRLDHQTLDRIGVRTIGQQPDISKQQRCENGKSDRVTARIDIVL